MGWTGAGAVPSVVLLMVPTTARLSASCVAYCCRNRPEVMSLRVSLGMLDTSHNLPPPRPRRWTDCQPSRLARVRTLLMATPKNWQFFVSCMSYERRPSFVPICPSYGDRKDILPPRHARVANPALWDYGFSLTKFGKWPRWKHLDHAPEPHPSALGRPTLLADGGDIWRAQLQGPFFGQMSDSQFILQFAEPFSHFLLFNQRAGIFAELAILFRHNVEPKRAEHGA